MPYDADLADRIRSQLSGHRFREVAMFGGRSFMVHDKLAIAASADGTLLVRCAPDDLDRLLGRGGARPAEMRGKPMSAGWIRVRLDDVADDADLTPWIADAIGYAARDEAD